LLRRWNTSIFIFALLLKSSNWMTLFIVLICYTLIIRSLLLYDRILVLFLERRLWSLDSVRIIDVLYILIFGWSSSYRINSITLGVCLISCRCITTLLLLKALTCFITHSKLIRSEWSLGIRPTRNHPPTYNTWASLTTVNPLATAILLISEWIFLLSCVVLALNLFCFGKFTLLLLLESRLCLVLDLETCYHNGFFYLVLVLKYVLMDLIIV
jgi:hypothetical protein